MNQMTMNQLKEEVHQMKKKEEASASLQLSVTRSGTKYQISVGTKEDVQKVPMVYSIWGADHESKGNTAQLSTQAVANAAAVMAAAGATTHEPHDGDTKQVIARINAEPKPEQLNIGTTLAPTAATAAAEKAAADVAALERAAAEQTLKENTAQHSTQAVAIGITTAPTVADAAAEKAAADVAALERAAAEQTGATVAVEQAVAIKTGAEAVTTGGNLHEELERMQLMLIAERAAAAAARDEATAAIYILEAENKRLLLLLAAANSPVPVPVAAANSPVPANANLNGPTTRTQPATLAMSNSLTYAQAVTSSVPDVRRLPRTNDLGGDHTANAASSSATAGTDPAIMMNPTVLRHNPADNAEAAAMQAAADAAAAAAKCNDRAVLRAVLLAAAATAKALAQTGAQDTGTVQPRRRGGRPPPTRTRKANPTRPRRPRKPAGTVAAGPPEPTATGTSTAKQLRWTRQPTASSSPPRGGQKARRQTGTFFARSDSAVTSLPATRNVPPKIEPTVMHVNARD